jgi:hypothetical protein
VGETERAAPPPSRGFYLRSPGPAFAFTFAFAFAVKLYRFFSPRAGVAALAFVAISSRLLLISDLAGLATVFVDW